MDFFTGSYRSLASRLADILHQRTSTFDAWLERPVEILVPSRSVAAGIASALLERRPEGLAGVVMQTPEELARTILTRAGSHQRVASDDERRLAMRAAVAAIPDPAFERRGAAAMAERTYRDIRDSALTVDEFEARSRRARGAHTARMTSLCAAFREYESHIRGISAIDPADLLRNGGAAASRVDVAPQIVFGFYDVTGIQENFVRALASRGAVAGFFVPVELDDAHALSSGTRFGHRFFETARSIAGVDPQAIAAAADAPIRVRTSFAPEIEILELCRGVRDALDEGLPPGALAIVTRALDPAEHRELARCARLFDFRIAPEPGRRLAGERLARGLLLLLRLRRDNFRRSDVIELLHCGIDPDEIGLTDSAEWLDRSTRICEIPGGTAESIRLALPRIRLEREKFATAIAAYAEVVSRLEELTRELDRPRRSEEWAVTLERLATMFLIETDGDLTARNAVSGIAAMLRATSSFRAPFDAETIATMIADAPEIAPAADAALPAVWAGDVMRLRGRSFRRVWAMRLQHDRFPQRRVDDPLLPDYLRKEIGVREIGDGRDEERILFRILTTSATEVLECSYAISDGLGATLRPSPLLKDALIAIHPEDKSEIVGRFDEWLEPNAPPELKAKTAAEREADAVRMGHAVPGEGLMRRLRAVSRFGTQSPWDGVLTVDEPLAAKLAEALAKLSPSYLEWFGECPHHFLYGRILGIDDLPEPEEQIQIERRNKGVLEHEILQRFYEEVFASHAAKVPEWSPALAKQLARWVDSCFDDFDATHPPSNPALRNMERTLTHEKLAAFVQADFEALREAGLVPKHFELAFGGSPGAPERLPVRVGAIELPLRGVIDRIDLDADGIRHRIVDYKSGRAGKQKGLGDKIDAGHALQLAFYAIAIAQIHGLKDENVSGRILPLDDPDASDKHFAFELAEKRPVLEAILPLFLQAMKSGVYPAFTKSDPKDAKWCDYCALRPHCRTYHSIEEKRSLNEFENVRELLERRGGTNA